MSVCHALYPAKSPPVALAYTKMAIGLTCPDIKGKTQLTSTSTSTDYLIEMDATSSQRTNISDLCTAIATATDAILTLASAAVHGVKVNFQTFFPLKNCLDFPPLQTNMGSLIVEIYSAKCSEPLMKK